MVTGKRRLGLPSFDYQGFPCTTCGEIIDVYSTSGKCRKCWHANRKGQRVDENFRYYCSGCGTPMALEGQCVSCQLGDKERLIKYRTVRGIPEHRYVYIKRRGELPPNYVIHHLNGLKGDNRIENLCAMSRSKHDTKHIIHELEKRLRELEGR